MCSYRDKPQDEISDSSPFRRGRVQQQVAGVKLVKLDGSAEAAREVARVPCSNDAVRFALQDERWRVHGAGGAAPLSRTDLVDRIRRLR